LTPDTSDGEGEEGVADSELPGQAEREAEAKAAAAELTREEGEDFELLEKVKTTAPNGTGKAVKRNKKSGKGR
jgi:hypothetical protein